MSKWGSVGRPSAFTKEEKKATPTRGKNPINPRSVRHRLPDVFVSAIVEHSSTDRSSPSTISKMLSSTVDSSTSLASSLGSDRQSNESFHGSTSSTSEYLCLQVCFVLFFPNGGCSLA